MEKVQSGSIGFKAVSEILQELTIDDSSVHALLNDLKAHPQVHMCWLVHLKNARNNLTKAENRYADIVNTHVATYRQTAKSATDVQNYAKYDVPILNDVRSARDDVAYWKEMAQFFEDVQRVFSKRGDILVALTKLDQDAIINDMKAGQAAYFDSRQAMMRFNRLSTMVNTGTWGAGNL